MGKDICPFLTREENQETACIREKCYIYDAKSKSCKLTTLSGDISADYRSDRLIPIDLDLGT